MQRGGENTVEEEAGISQMRGLKMLGGSQLAIANWEVGKRRF